MKRRLLIEFRPEWLSTGGTRYGMGVRLLCPGHIHANHHVEFWFQNPLDGEGSLPASEILQRQVRTLYHRLGSRLDNLTILPPGDGSVLTLEAPGHWRGYIAEGMLWDSRAT